MRRASYSLVEPLKNRPVSQPATAAVFPFGFGGQSFVHVSTILVRIVPRDMNYWMMQSESISTYG
jgi:hypothetical protein